MQYNIYYIEILGEEKLKGVTIPVVVDNKRTLTNEQMADVAKILNTYRTVFVRSNSGDNISSKVYNVKGEIWDCLYGNVASIFTLIETSYIREIEVGEKYITLENAGIKSKVSITYENLTPISVNHETDITCLNTRNSMCQDGYCLDVVENENNKDQYTKIIYTEDAIAFSKLRKKKIKSINSDMDYLLVFYDKENKMTYFHVQRVYNSKSKLDSRTQLGFIVSYLLSKGIDKEDIKRICHVLNTGQYAIMKVGIEEEKIYIKMEASTLVEGILNI